jgi:hypothetical protein
MMIDTAMPSPPISGSRTNGTPYHQTSAASATVWLASSANAARPSEAKRPQGCEMGGVMSCHRRACPGDPDQEGEAVPK